MAQETCAAADILGILCDPDATLLAINSVDDIRGRTSVRSALFKDDKPGNFNICTRHFEDLKERPKGKCSGDHPIPWTTRLHNITLDEYVHSSKLGDASADLKQFVLAPNKQLCPTHYSEYLINTRKAQQCLPSSSESDATSGSHFSPQKRAKISIPLSQAMQEFNAILQTLAIAQLPDYFNRQNTERQKHILLEKMDQIWTATRQRAANIVPSLAQEGFSVNEARSAVKEVRQITGNMKTQLENPYVPIILKLQIASLCPADWSERVISNEIGVSRYVARKSKTMNCLVDEVQKEGFGKSEVLKSKIADFWRRSDISRELPGKNDYKRIRTTDGWQKQQKKLLYVTYSEAYEIFMGTNTRSNERQLGEIMTAAKDEELEQLLFEENLSLSTFVKYKPEEVVPMSTKRRHNVCVCRYHENARLICERIGLKNMSFLMSLLTCSTDENVLDKDCMYLRCSKCSNNTCVLEEHVYLHMKGKNMLDRDFNIQQWVKTDATTFVTTCVSGGDYPNVLTQQLKDLMKHQYVTKNQNDFFQKAKEGLDDTTGVVVLDFSENFVPTYQNEIQAMHFGSNRTRGQATLHPIAIYIKVGKEVQCKQTCIITDYMDHTQNAVHCFINVFLGWVRTTFSHLTRFKFFSDGCAGQYKSVKAFKNMSLFSNDFPGLTMSWSYFATSHGKNVCDGIGGYMKRCAFDAVLRESVVITNGKDLHKFVQEKIPKLTCFYLDRAVVEDHIQEKKLNERYEKLDSVHGTLGIHHVVPWEDNCGVDLFEVGLDKVPFTRHRFGIEPFCVTDDLLGETVACVYQNEWFIGEVESIDPEEEELYIKFFTKPNKLTGKMQMGRTGDECFVPFGRILGRVDVREESTGRTKKFAIDFAKVSADLDHKLEEFLKRK